MLPLLSIASVSPCPIFIVIFPPFISTVGVPILDFSLAFIPSSLASIFIVPSSIFIKVASIPSADFILNDPPLIVTFVIPCIPSLFAVIL